MTRTFVTILTISLAASIAAADTASVDCTARAAARAAALYNFAAKQFRRCSKAAAAGRPCDVAARDAKVATKLAKTQASIRKKCSDFDGTRQGFADADGLAVSVAGGAAGEGRQVADSLFGRVPRGRPPQEGQCAALIASEVAKAGRQTIQALLPCLTADRPGCVASLNTAWNDAQRRILGKCTATALQSLVGGNLVAQLASMRAGATRAADAFLRSRSFRPKVSVLAPASNETVTPDDLPFDLAVEGTVAGVPHAGYVSAFAIEGREATFEAGTNFARTVTVGSPGGARVTLFLEARTTLGTVATTKDVRLDVDTLTPDVQIAKPISGAITTASTIEVSGRVIGDLADGSLIVDGQFTAFDAQTGSFKVNVALGAEPVQIIEAAVESLRLGTRRTDSVVVLKGTGWPTDQRVPSAHFTRVNNSGFKDVTGVLQATLDNAFAPENFIGGDTDHGGTICEFSSGAKGIDVAAIDDHLFEGRVRIEALRTKVCDIDLFNCDLTFSVDTTTIILDADLEIHPSTHALTVLPRNTQVDFVGATADDGGCALPDDDLIANFHNRFSTDAALQMPVQINGALAELDIGGPIGESLDVELATAYREAREDATGVTFVVDSNMTPTSPVADVPIIDHTLMPANFTPPVLGATVPGTNAAYDLGFCLTDAFLNRALAAFTLQGRLNLSFGEIPLGGSVIVLDTNLLSAITGDAAFSADCPGCGVTLVLKPTAPPVARAPLASEPATVILLVPNYRIDIVVDDGGVPHAQLTALMTFTVPITLDVANGESITPRIGTLRVDDLRVVNNPIGANETQIRNAVVNLFPLAAQALGDLFGEITLPSFQGLQVSPVGAGYNRGCAMLYLDLM